MDAQTSSNIIMGVIGLIALGGLVTTVGAYFYMGRQAYRKE
ncbi:hypothetical protein [Microbacterium mangrovi]|jgi:hypothetical protein|nr:hypothetical protein [Microbacterium mangrovi]